MEELILDLINKRVSITSTIPIGVVVDTLKKIDKEGWKEWEIFSKSNVVYVPYRESIITVPYNPYPWEPNRPYWYYNTGDTNRLPNITIGYGTLDTNATISSNITEHDFFVLDCNNDS